jgi:cobalt-zinc-cadmium resistance protein CzcA
MIARIVTWAVEKRWLVLLLTVIVAAIGAFSLYRLPIDAVPDITNNQVQINVRAPALSPELVEKQVSFPIETALAGTPGLEYTRSLSRNGFAQITAVFSDATDIYFARQQVGERLRGVQENLPDGVNPEMGPIATGLGEVYMYTVRLDHREDDKHKPGEPGQQPDGSYITPEGERLTTEEDKATYLRTAQDWIVTPLLKTTPGLAGVDSIGGYAKQFLVVPDVQKLASLGITLTDLGNALERNNTSVGGGFVNRNGEGLAVRSDALVRNASELARTVIATRNGVPITVEQVATVKTGQAIRMGSASENGTEVVVGTAIMRIGENSRIVSTAVAEKLKTINASLPPDVVIQPVLNRTELVNSTIKTVAKNLSEGAVLVIVVLFLLLGNFRAALIAALVIPITMMLTGFGMLRAGVSANLMSLGALDFGLIVDGAVIIVENALRRLAEQQHHEGRLLTVKERLATVAAAARDDPPSVYGQAIIILVYVPLLTLTGVEGKTFGPMALTVIIALAFAFILSHLRAGDDCDLAVEEGRGEGRPHHHVAEEALRTRSRPGHEAPDADDRCGCGKPCGGGACFHYARLGVPAAARRRRFADPVAPHSGNVGPAEPGDAGADRADDVEAAGGAIRLFQDGHRRAGGRPDAAERDRHVRHPEAAQGLAGS